MQAVKKLFPLLPNAEKSFQALNFNFAFNCAVEGAERSKLVIQSPRGELSMS